MRISNLLASLAFVTVAIPSVSAAPQETGASKHEHATAPEQTGRMHMMVERARKAKTPAERTKLMAENMVLMQAHMMEMNTTIDIGGILARKMMDGKAMPMVMDAAHMEKMHKHMMMMRQMMENLMVQQELMMKPAPR